MPFISPTERRIATIQSARDFLEERGCRTRAIHKSSTPVIEYETTGMRRSLSADELIAYAVSLGHDA